MQSPGGPLSAGVHGVSGGVHNLPGSLLRMTLGTEPMSLFHRAPELFKVLQKCPASPGLAFLRMLLPIPLHSNWSPFPNRDDVQGCSMEEDHSGEGHHCCSG